MPSTSSLGDRRDTTPRVLPVVVTDVVVAESPPRAWWGLVTCTLCVLSGTAVGVWAALR